MQTQTHSRSLTEWYDESFELVIDGVFLSQKAGRVEDVAVEKELGIMVLDVGGLAKRSAGGDGVGGVIFEWHRECS